MAMEAPLRGDRPTSGICTRFGRDAPARGVMPGIAVAMPRGMMDRGCVRTLHSTVRSAIGPGIRLHPGHRFPVEDSERACRARCAPRLTWPRPEASRPAVYPEP